MFVKNNNNNSVKCTVKKQQTAWYNVNIPTDWSTEIGFVSLKYTDHHQMQVVMRVTWWIKAHNKLLFKIITLYIYIYIYTHIYTSTKHHHFIKLKYAININLIALNVMYNPKKNITDKKLFQRKNIKFKQNKKMQRRNSGNISLLFFPANFTGTYR